MLGLNLLSGPTTRPFIWTEFVR